MGGVPPGHRRLTGLQLGTVSILVGIPVLAAWYPLGERPGVGTVLNIAIIGTATNVAMGIMPAAEGLAQQAAMMLAGVATIAVGSGLYLASDLGPGPRDGLMTGLHVRFGWSIRRARTGIELGVLVLGFLLGGTIGIGTIVFALGIGPLSRSPCACSTARAGCRSGAGRSSRPAATSGSSGSAGRADQQRCPPPPRRTAASGS